MISQKCHVSLLTTFRFAGAFTSTPYRPLGFTCNNSQACGCHRFESENVHFHSAFTFTSMSGTFRREEQAPRSYINPRSPPLPLSFLLRRQGVDSKCLFTGLAPWRLIALAFCCAYTNTMLRALSPFRSRSSLTSQQHRDQISP